MIRNNLPPSLQHNTGTNFSHGVVLIVLSFIKCLWLKECDCKSIIYYRVCFRLDVNFCVKAVDTEAMFERNQYYEDHTETAVMAIPIESAK